MVHAKKLFRFFVKNGISQKNFKFSKIQKLISKTDENQLFRFLPKKWINFFVLFFLKFFRLISEIGKNRIIFFGNLSGKLFRFFQKNQISRKSFKFFKTSKTISKNCKNQFFCFLTKKRIVFDDLFFEKFFNTTGEFSKNQVFFSIIHSGKLNLFSLKNEISQKNYGNLISKIGKKQLF